jgi:hypothetical protein
MPEVARKQIPEVWLNPGSESDALIRLARSLNVEPIHRLQHHRDWGKPVRIADLKVGTTRAGPMSRT